MKKSLLLIIFNLIIFSITYSQTTFSLKAKIENRYPFRGVVVQAKNSNLIVPLNTDSGLFILRIEKTGEAKWQYKFGLNGDQVIAICITPDNGFACFGNIYNRTTGNRQLTLFKCDSTGKIQWAKSLGLDYSNNYIYADQLILDSKNNYVITYQFNSKFSDISQIRIVKFNEDGNIIFQTGFKNLYNLSYQSLHLSSIAESFDGGFLIGLNYVNSLFGIEYSFLLLTNSSGNVVSYKPFNVDPFSAEDYQAPISFYKNNGKYYVIGYYNHYENDEVKEYYYFTSFNKKKQILNSELIPYNRFALEHFVIQNKIPIKNIDGYITNAHNLTAIDYAVNEIFINRYDSSGRICPDYSLPEYDSSVIQKNIFIGDEITGVQKSVDDIILTNNKINIQNVNLIEEECLGENSLFATGNKSENDRLSNISTSIFPNPAHNTITISIPSVTNQTQISLFNSDGKLLQSFSVYSNSNKYSKTINIATYPNGIYVIKISDHEYTQILKFIKE
jgi:hypothetical protein